MPTIPYIPTNSLLETWGAHTEGFFGTEFDAVLMFDGSVDEGLRQRFGYAKPEFGRGLLAYGIVEETNARPSSAGTPIQIEQEVQVVVVIPAGGQSGYAKAVRRLHDISDRLKFACYDPRTTAEITPSFGQAWQRVMWTRSVRADGGGGHLCRVHTYRVIPQRQLTG